MKENAMKYHFLYKTINIVTSKYYIGVHTTDALDDGYLGSGVVIKRSIQKYGVDKHERQVIQFFETREACLLAEKECITEGMIADLMCMNLRQGGRGGFTSDQQRQNNVKSQVAQQVLKETDPEWQARKVLSCSTSQLALYASNSRPITATPHVLGEYKHTEEVKRRISLAATGKHVGTANSQFGTMWITNGLSNKKINKADSLPLGFRKGRVLKIQYGE
jgi:hypothetical protein